MSNINNLTSKILSDAEERKESILKEANEEKAKIVSKKEALAKSEEATMVEKAKTEAKTAKERIISGAELRSRNEKLTAKQAVIDKVFEKSIEKLCKMSDQEIKEFIKNKIVNADVVGDETIILNEKGNKLVDANLLKEINSELLAKGKKGELTISKEVRNFKGGFILEKDGIEINNTFEDLVNSERDDLEFEVAKVLFN
ncbi:MAG: V-type ATP synthase subunit E [Clostridium baratii]|uniref:V-type proton ATPase subunit E n=1 Tax=Clostridium baratii str. Sullivan TaxID=1415775 RepID=A0A0A7FZA5_9CLOT|nr:V-type ATP synthase subunit E family protein [Clostridium baratii]AIY84928.1 ATP synthase (E/31 kDa) subunit [Clostridium baratii str. Sullivan]MBS6005668.1 V-type ATP synthase subunit E [Clostridium baratii]MDU1052734.1 V-type ATP synthase subunit E family protein [Clostridium baratii]MDU4910229.1 V-type ATP synthase subunit E family protein [Clostridium baratii]CUP27136.1 ATP synthase (E/31 kDa) subunit [Clostridium baratii]